METKNLSKNGYTLKINLIQIDSKIAKKYHNCIFNEIKDIYDNFGLEALISNKFALWSQFSEGDDIKIDSYAISVEDKAIVLFLKTD